MFAFLPLPSFKKYLFSALPMQSALALREVRGISINLCFLLLWGFGRTVLLHLVANPDLQSGPQSKFICWFHVYLFPPTKDYCKPRINYLRKDHIVHCGQFFNTAFFAFPNPCFGLLSIIFMVNDSGTNIIRFISNTKNPPFTSASQPLFKIFICLRQLVILLYNRITHGKIV